MKSIELVRNILDETLGLGGRSQKWTEDQALLGDLPELTSQAVVDVLMRLEDRLEIVIADDELDADTFATIGSLTRFIETKLGQ